MAPLRTQKESHFIVRSLGRRTPAPAGQALVAMDCQQCTYPLICKGSLVACARTTGKYESIPSTRSPILGWTPRARYPTFSRFGMIQTKTLLAYPCERLGFWAPIFCP